MRCPEVRDLLPCFLDGELEVEKNVQVLKHLELCPRCKARSDQETALRGVVVRCCAEPLDQVTRARLVSGAFARDARVRVRRLIAVAASLLLVLGAAGFALKDPFCWRGCPTTRLLHEVRTAMRSPPVPLSVLEDEFKRPIYAPQLRGVQMSGGNVVRNPGGCPCLPVVRYRCGEGQLCFFEIPAGHAHAGRRHVLPDGREGIALEHDGVTFIGWVRPDGVLVGCMPCRSMSKHPQELEVYALALFSFSSGRY